MSDALRRLYRMATGADKEQRAAASADRTPALTTVPFEKPLIVQELEQIFEMRYGVGNAPQIRYFPMRSKLTFDAQSGTLKSTAAAPADGERPEHLPVALAIERIYYDTTHMPVDVQLQLHGLRPQFVTQEEARKTGRLPPIRLRDDVLPPRESSRYTRTLLQSALVFKEPLSQTQFSSVEAIGFNATFFFSAIAVPVSDELASRHQRLFWPGRATFSPGSSNKSLHSSGTLGFYWVPLSYKYTVLLINVHAYLAVQDACRDPAFHFDSNTVDPAVYELPSTNTRVLFEYAALHAAADFIEEHLLGIHPRFYPPDLTLSALPFASVSWSAVESERSALLEPSALFDGSERPPMELYTEHLVYFAYFDNVDEQPGSPALQSASPALLSQRSDSCTGSYEESDDDEDEDDVSLNFTTPRTANPTPRAATLAGFLDGSAAAALASDTVSDHGFMRSSPVRMHVSPARVHVSPARIQQSPARLSQSGTLHEALPPRRASVTHDAPINTAGTAQSDDHSEPSPTSEVSLAPVVSEQSSSEIPAALTAEILRDANKRLLDKQSAAKQ